MNEKIIGEVNIRLNFNLFYSKSKKYTNFSVLRAIYASEPKIEDTEYGRLYTCGFDSVIYRVDFDFRDQGRSVRPVQK